MSKRFPYLLTLLLGLAACYGFIAAKAPTAGKQYDYVTLEKVVYRLYVSQNGGPFEERKIKEDIKDIHDQGPLLSAINEFEAKGYEVYTVNSAGYASSGGTNMAQLVLLRKPK